MPSPIPPDDDDSQAIVEAFLATTQAPDRSFVMHIEGSIDDGGFQATIAPMRFEVEGQDFTLAMTTLGFAQQFVEVGGQTWTRIGDEPWSREGAVTLAEPFAALDAASVSYVEGAGQRHRISANDPLPAFRAVMTSESWTQVDVEHASLVFVVDALGRPIEADLVLRGTRTGPVSGPVTVDLHYAFERWGDDFAIEPPPG